MAGNLDCKYRLVVFLGDKKKSKKEVIDIVPNQWIYSDDAFEDLRCKFMPESMYNEDNLQLLNDMVRQCAKPCSDWPSYSVEIRGRARSYEEAEKLMDKLQYQPYVYSTDNETNAKNKAKKDKEFFKIKKLPPNKTNELLADATLDLTVEPEFNSEVDHQFFDDNSEQILSGTAKSSEKNSKNSKDRKQIALIKKSCGTKRKRSSSAENLSETDKCTDNSSSEEDFVNKYKIARKSNSQYSTNTVSRQGSSSGESEDDRVDTSQSKTDLAVDKNKSSDNNESTKHYMNEELLTKVFTKLLAPIIKEQKSINAQLSSLSKSVNDLKGSVLQIQRVYELNIPASSAMENNLDNDDIKIPCSGITDFTNFNEKLKSDEEYRNKIARRLTALANPNQALIRSTAPMMRLGMSRELALQFNLKKPNEKKTKIFIDTQFYKLIKGVIVKKFSKSVDDPLPDATINDSISSVLNHCGDWEGGRTERKKIQTQKKIATVDGKLGLRNSSNKENIEQEKDVDKSNEAD